MAKVYRREKDEQGQWRYLRVNMGAGRRGAQAPPYYLRYMEGGRRKLSQPYSTFEGIREAYLAFEKRAHLPKQRDASERISIQDAVDVYLEQKANKEPRTVLAYRLVLNQFAELCGVRFLDEITVEVLRAYKVAMEKQGLSAKTINTRVNITYFMLKKNGITARVPLDEMPTVEEMPAVPYTEKEIKKLFKAMTADEQILFNFFLGSGCRDREVMFAAWNDIDFGAQTYTVRNKEDVGFKVKRHQQRTLRLPPSVIKTLKARQKNGHERWIFPNERGEHGDHFLRKLKAIGLRAGLNCGQCTKELTAGHSKYRKKITVTCKTHPVCDHVYLHRFRKSCATRWNKAHGSIPAIDINTIREWLGHKDLATTQKYLGVTPTEQLGRQVRAAFGD